MLARAHFTAVIIVLFAMASTFVVPSSYAAYEAENHLGSCRHSARIAEETF